MKKYIECLLILVSINFYGHAQFSRYIIQLKDKTNSPYSLNNPSTFLSQASIERRARYGIAPDSTDLPVNPAYIDSIRLSGNVTILNASKWLNSITIQTTDPAAIIKINNFPFVQKTEPTAARFIVTPHQNKHTLETDILQFKSNGVTKIDDYYEYGNSLQQVNMHHGDFLHNIGLRGQSMKIGLLDGGFFKYTSLRAFDSVNINNKVIDIYDFVAHDNTVTEDDAHGMECFSILAANIPGQFVGSAPMADYFLFRTEDVYSEYPIEEHNWVCGAERVDSSGGDMISSSLGYSTFDDPAFNHTYSDMNGRTTIAAKGASFAARKGLLVVNAVGNDGNNGWHFLSTPADADSIMAVGAINASGTISSFSSYGPSADNRIKPDVVSLGQGTTIETPGNTVGAGSGTSFSTPNIAGLTACLWQGFREFNNIDILKAMRQSGSNYNNPDNRLGFGIPDMKIAMIILLKQFATVSINLSGCNAMISWKSKDAGSMKYELERKLPDENSFKKIGEQQGLGIIFAEHNYQYRDTLVNVPVGNILYRIRQVIDTSTSSFTADYIANTSLDLNTSCNIISPGTNNNIEVFPNPALNSFILRLTTTSDVPHLNIRILNIAGQMVYSTNTSKKAGTNSFPVTFSRFPSGKYFVEIYSDKKLLGTKQFIKL